MRGGGPGGLGVGLVVVGVKAMSAAAMVDEDAAWSAVELEAMRHEQECPDTYRAQARTASRGVLSGSGDSCSAGWVHDGTLGARALHGIAGGVCRAQAG